jgi:hypothetical protein
MTGYAACILAAVLLHGGVIDGFLQRCSVQAWLDKHKDFAPGRKY